jgi:hypothetical protein
MVNGAGTVVLRLRARQAEIEDAVFARVREVVPEATGLADAEYVTGLRATVAALTDYSPPRWTWPAAPSQNGCARSKRGSVGRCTPARRSSRSRWDWMS